MNNIGKLKVLYLSPNGYLGGAENFVYLMTMLHLQNNQIEPGVLFFNDGEVVQKVNNLGAKSYLLKTKFKFSKPWQLIQAILEARKYIKEFNPDILHMTMPYAHIVGYFASLFLGKKIVWFQHGPVGTIFDKLAALLPCDIVMFNSSYLMAKHNEMIALPPKDGQVKIHGLVTYKQQNQDDVSKLRSEILGDKKLLIGMAGRITEWKGFHNFLKVVKKLKTELDADTLKLLKFIIIGKANRPNDKLYEESLHAFAKENQLEDLIEFTGFVPDIHTYYAAMDVFIHASTIPEPLGVVAGEPMHHETLVIGSSQGGIKELIRDGETGFSFDSTASNADGLLYDKLLSVIQDYKKNDFNNSPYEVMLQRAKKFVNENYSMEKVSKEIESTYLSL